MSPQLDVRTKIYCNLGTVISGSLQEGTIVGAGLINVTGSILLDGVYRVGLGSTVQLSYYKNGRMTRLGRRLRAISVYANPVTRTTEVQLGCKLTMLKDSEPPPRVFSSLEDADTEDLTGIEKLLMLKPTKAKFIAEQCCNALGISYESIPLTNQFYQEEFKISGKYLNTLSDLLISEGYVGYLTFGEKLKVINIASAGGSGPVLDENKIIAIEPINSGDPDADTVYSIVNFKTVKLDAAVTADEEGGEGGGGTEETVEEVLERNNIDPFDPVVINLINDVPPATPEQEQQQEAARNQIQKPPYFLRSYEDNGVQVRRFRYQPPKVAGVEQNPIESTLSYRSITERTTKYDSLDRPYEHVEVVTGPWGTHVNVTTTEYFKEGDTEKVVRRTEKRVRNEDAVEACGFPPIVMNPLPADIRSFASRYNGNYVLAEVTVQTTVATAASVITTQSRSAAAYATSAGAANIQKYIESYTLRRRENELPDVFTGAVIDTILNMAIQFVQDKTTVSYAEKAPDASVFDGFKQSPAGYTVTTTGEVPVSSGSISWEILSEEEKEDLVNRELESDLSGDPTNVLENTDNTASIEEEADEKNGYTASVVEVPEIILSEGTASSGVILELTPPYLSDDKINKVGDFYSVTPSDAREKAQSFARLQNRLRYGYRNGQSVVFPVELTPIRPFSPLYLKFNGVVGQYRSDRLNIVFDSSGILVSTDAIFWGGVGQ